MLPFTKSDSVALKSALIADNDVAATLEPADGTVSLESNAYEEFVVETRMNNLVASAVSASVQFYGKNTNDGDVSATWTAIGVLPGTAPIVEASGASIGEKVLTARLHSRNVGYKYVSAIVALTFADQGAATSAAATLRGEIARRDV
jgi:hypothetical protein